VPGVFCFCIGDVFATLPAFLSERIRLQLMHENFAKSSSPESGPRRPAPLFFGRSGSAIYWLTITLLLFGVFLADLYSPFGVAIPTSYVAALLLVLALPGAREKILVALISTVLIVLDYFLTPGSPAIPGWIPIFNDVLTVTLIWIVAGLGLRHRRAQDAMRQSEERFRALVEASSQIVWTADGAGNIVEDSPSWRAFTGQTIEQRRGAGWLNAYHPNDHKRIQVQWEDATARKTPLEAQYRLRRHDGQWRWTSVRAVPLLSADGSARGWVGMNTDITERKQAEADTLFLLDLSDCIRLASDPDELTWAVAVAAGEYLQTERCSFTEANPESDRFTIHRDYHLNLHSLVGTYRMSALGPKIVSDCQAGQNTVVFDTSRDHRTARYKENYQRIGVGAFAATPLLREGRLVSALFVSTAEPHDWSEREVSLIAAAAERTWLAVERLRLNSALRQSEEALRDADRRKDEFLATLAHELRNPLALVRNVVSLSQSSGFSEAQQRWGRDVIDKQVGYLTRLTDDLFDISRITREKLGLHKEHVELCEIVKTAVESSRPLIEERGHKITITLPASPVYVDADRVRLTQVLMNLINNAAKYTPDPGQIWLTLGLQNDHAILQVKDTGIGVAPEDLPRLFDLFYQADRSFTRAEGGLGLGLTLVQRILELHGGTVQAFSLGAKQGSQFVVSLPVLQKALQQESSKEVNGDFFNAKSRVRRILVADDFPQAAETLAGLLRQEGYEVQIAQDGLEAFQSAERSHPDVIVLDLAMPELNGYDAARKIREQPWGKQVVLIALTGWGQQQDRHRTKEAGFDAHLTKPVKYEAILELLGNLPNRQRPGSAAPAV
jgi:PAS domain S-box-containing protein